MPPHPEPDRLGWRQEGQALLRAVAGGSLVGMPLLYTMEMWSHGMTVAPAHLLGILLATILTNWGFCYISGFRHERGVGAALEEAVTAVGIAAVFSTAVLWLIGGLRLPFITTAAAGKIVLQAAAVSIGISFANSQVEGKSRRAAQSEDKAVEESGCQESAEAEREQLKVDLQDAAAAVVGATVFALNVAPTEEITLIAARLQPWQTLLLLGASVGLCYVILYAAELKERQVHVDSLAQRPWAETLLTSAIALSISAVLLALFGEAGVVEHPGTAVARIVVLGLPATVGGAAGRLIA